MITLTYGQLPEFKVFEQQFNSHCGSGSFKIENCKRVGTYRFTCGGLWEELQEAIRDYNTYKIVLDEDTGETGKDKEAIDWAHNVLYSLGIEWI